eukprot:TRINITY_DN1437_c0_g1_i2.p1 TRINITY_DN1437_c0_g1~~TRINITY_DN1437_c0_g1_i2.p1  ORF type:complete len:288 (-),score=71.38 TRINITY_DN1437_c0_g1_i2:361-1224(-)
MLGVLRWIGVTMLFVSCQAAYRPVVIMHGMNNNVHGYQKNVVAIQAKYPGIYVTSLNVYNDASSMLTHMDKQIAAVAQAIRADPNLKHGFNFYGESQGALLARAYVTLYNDPPVYNLVGLNGPQAGVGECPSVEVPVIKQLCADIGTDLQIYRWPFCSFCSYWRGKGHASYLRNSQWLADVNNQRSVNQTRRQNMMALNQYMVTVASQDKTVQPKESAWHTFWYWGDDQRKRVMPYNQTQDYVDDVLGLQTLDKRGDLLLNSFDGGHCGYQMDWWNSTVLPMFDNQL